MGKQKYFSYHFLNKSWYNEEYGGFGSNTHAYARWYVWKSVFKSKHTTSLDNTNIKLNTCLKLPRGRFTDTSKTKKDKRKAAEGRKSHFFLKPNFSETVGKR